MKRQIRLSVFESNSSSTHSVSIRSNSTIKFQDIPTNSEVILNGTYEYGTDIFDELGKLNYVVTMLASIVEYRVDEEDLDIKSFEDMISLNWFKWLADVVKEDCNTDVIYKCPTYSNGRKKSYYPYYNTTSDEDCIIEDIFTDNNPDILDDEMKFKERVRDIIFNPTTVIEDKTDEW